MMKFILFSFFLIPIISKGWVLYNFSFVILMIMFVMMNVNLFYCCLGYFFGLDYISYGLLILTFIIISLMNLSMVNNSFSYNFIVYLIYLSLFFIFCSVSMFLMYVFFEFSLLPLLVLILGWGYQPERLVSSVYLLFYTLFASLPLLVLIIFMYLNFYSVFFDYCFHGMYSFILYFFMIFAFLVKFPMFMFHFWLPKAHVQAPVSGSMVLAGIFLKIGGYGLIRFMNMFDYNFIKYSFMWFSISMWGAILVSMICFVQSDIKSMIAYSSISHMSMCLMGLLSMNHSGLLGSYLMMLGHGFCSSGMFYISYLIYNRLSSRSFFVSSGLINFMPSMSLMWFLYCCFNMSCPPSLNFLSEIFIMISMMSYFNFSYLFLFMISFFSACFSFYLYSYCNHGSFYNSYSYSYIFVHEYMVMIIHLIPIFFMIFIINKIFL